MIKVELRSKKKLKKGIADCGCDIEIVGDVNTISIELANLLTAITVKYPFVMDIAQKYMEDNLKLMEVFKNDKTDIDNN
jgi:hypothetical protein